MSCCVSEDFIYGLISISVFCTLFFLLNIVNLRFIFVASMLSDWLEFLHLSHYKIRVLNGFILLNERTLLSYRRPAGDM